jgi:DNA-binding SARP family transcriptional activator
VVEFRILGPLGITGSDGLVELGSAKLRSVLALLLIHADEVVSAERLIDDLWEGVPPRSAHATLQTHI